MNREASAMLLALALLCAASAALAQIEVPPAELLAPERNDFPRRGPAISFDDTWEALTAGENLALGRPYRFARTPDYGATRDDGDLTQLTDGQIIPGDHIWYSKQAVGWSGCEPPALVAIDLGEVRAIDAVVAHVQGGGAQVASLRYPRRFDVFVSDDGEAWRLVDSISKRVYADQEGTLFDLPESDAAEAPGDPHTHAFNFGDLRTRGRFVALQMHFDGPYSAIDEIAVMAGDHDPAGVQFDREPVRLVLDGVEALYPLPYLMVPRNVAGGFTLGARDSRADLSGPVTYRITVPATVTLGWRGAEPFERNVVELDGEPCAEYALTLTGRQSAVRSIYIQGDLDGPAQMRFHAEAGGVVQPEQTLRLLPVEVPPAPRTEHLFFALGWTGLDLQTGWPGAPEVFPQLGFTHASVGSWELPGALERPEAAEGQRWIEEAARPAGLKLVMTDSPWHIMESLWGREEGFAEAYMQTDPPRKALCLSYRGEYFQREVQRLVARYRFRQPEVIFFDVECFGPAGRELDKCARCSAVAAERGVDPKDLASDLFAEAAREIAGALNTAADELRRPRPLIGYYQSGPGWVYHNVLDFAKLYPEAAQIANPEFYGRTWPPAAAAIARRHKPTDPGIPLIMWTSPGTANWDGEAPFPRLFDSTLALLFNGALGCAYYTPSYLTPGDLLAQAQAVWVAAPVEEIIANATLVNDAVCETEGGHVWAIRAGEELLVLVGEFAHLGPREVTVRLPVNQSAQIVDLFTRAPIGTLAPEDNALSVRIEGAYRTRAFYVGRRWDERKPD